MDKLGITMQAYHNSPQLKSDILATLAAHRAADEIVKGQYWQDGKGCAVGCTIKSGNHMAYESQFGIPVVLAQIEDRIFEGLPNDKAMLWPERFMSAINVGADLSLVGWKFQWWLLTDEAVNPGINHPLVKDAVKLCADALYPLTKETPAGWSAARVAARSTALNAARVAESAALNAARVATRSTALNGAWSAWSASLAARNAAESAAYEKMADKLIDLLAECGGTNG